MIRSHDWALRAAARAVPLSTRSWVIVQPPSASSLKSNLASSSTSSMINTRNGFGIFSFPQSLKRRRFVKHEPVHSQLLNGVGEPIEVHRFANVTVRAVVVALDQVLLFLGTGEHDHRQSLCPLVGAETPKHFQPIQLGQFQIEQYQRG